MNNETVGSRMDRNVGNVIINVVDKNDQILTNPLKYSGAPGKGFSIEIPDLNGYVVQGLSGDQNAVSYLTNVTFKRNVDYPANVGRVVAVNPAEKINGTFARGTLNYNLVYAPSAQVVSPNADRVTSNQAAPSKKKHHWFRWIVIIFLIIILLGIFGLYHSGKSAQQQVKQNPPVVVKNYNNKPANNADNSTPANNSDNSKPQNNADNGGNTGSNDANQKAQNAIDNAKKEIESHIDNNNRNDIQQVITTIQDGFNMLAAKIQSYIGF
ncbi:hypothetical protein [Fructilactobacillus fructivorans]|uniref:Uncharacterized protein n=1 Tax=Fructilactobacillus fructivorans TaxID=1614 RepID=A0AAE6P3C2_9LACO|nr:hypothetical protein [Fructilactobacillus fructivorans]KRK57498.1 hypothetical protein FC73_GL001044 [Fructilactobacillus fructivorans]KRN39906.1 hypothetical protein IV51_GL000488 [Fructilactobacillus fructivorans]QFX93173.1 hypothetical protein LF543_06325 [Fructilactobacillus fructivorans]RDV64789.1 hypothetical protein DXU76_06775 [Fructilactobacillus fructivorans]